MKALYLPAYVLIFAGMAGCASISGAGVSSATIEPLPDGTCCKIQIIDGKERAARKVAFSMQGGNISLVIDETDVRAFSGQQIAADALSKAISDAADAITTAALAPLGVAGIGAAAGLLAK